MANPSFPPAPSSPGRNAAKPVKTAHASTLSIVYLPTDALKLDPRNPRLHSTRQLKQIARSIESFGFNVPVLIDASNKVLAGHGRVLAAQRLGLDRIPSIRLDGLSERQAQAFALADNRLTEQSTWDERMLGEIFRELSSVDLDFNLEDTGFSMGEIDLRILGLTDPVPDASDPADTLPEASSQPVITQLGDLWLLGKHRVLCGNALEADDYATLMQGHQARMVFTDSPYNVPINGHVCGKGKIQHREFAMATGEMNPQQFTQFLLTVMRLLAEHSVPGSLHYHCMDWAHLMEILTAGQQAYDEMKALCVWVKNNAGMGSLYRSQHEMVLVFKKGGAPHTNNIELGRHGRHRSNVWNYPGINTLSRQSEEGNLLAFHPTLKPVNLIADALLDTSRRGEIVLDCFLGSGSTLIAAERVGRVCYGLEIDPIYVDTIIRRWQRFSGETAIHAVTGQPFGQRIRRRVVTHG